MNSDADTPKGGFPHSDIHGSKLVRSSPWLFAAYHVLHRLSTPRHPPNALKTLDTYDHPNHAQRQIPRLGQLTRPTGAAFPVTV